MEIKNSIFNAGGNVNVSGSIGDQRQPTDNARAVDGPTGGAAPRSDQPPPLYSGRVRLIFRRHLAMSWRDLVAYLNMPANELPSGPPSVCADAIWDWLEARGEQSRLRDALLAVDREDLVEELDRDRRP